MTLFSFIASSTTNLMLRGCQGRGRSLHASRTEVLRSVSSTPSSATMSTATTEPTATTELAEPEPTAPPEPTEEPSPTEAQATDRTAEGDVDDATEPVVDEPTETVEQSGPTVRVLFAPTVDIQLTVYGVINGQDVLLFDGFVAAGTQTEVFEAGYFKVWTSDLNDTWVTNLDTGQTFYMSDLDGEGSFDLAP